MWGRDKARLRLVDGRGGRPHIIQADLRPLRKAFII